ncbi:MAG: TonB family protein [Alloprevotella sp.]
MTTYLLKVNLVCTLLFGLYMLLLRRDTFFRWKRFTLMGIYAVGWLLPLAQPNLWREGNEAVASFYIHIGLIDLLVAPPAATEKGVWPSMAWSELLLWGGYLAGMMFLLIRFFVQLAAICRLRARSTTRYMKGIKLYVPQRPQTPFSFFGWIFMHPSLHTPEEQEEILDHELAHVRQHHSVDVLLSELHCIVCWPNPIAWWMKREVRSNLEYLADAHVLNRGHNRKLYQVHLLALSCPMALSGLYNHFNVSPLKRRINMMNKKRSSRAGYLKCLLFLPLCALMSLVINADVWAVKAAQQERKRVTYSGTVVDVDGNRLRNVQNVLMDEASTEVVEEMPQFPGGYDALLKFLMTNTSYPAEAMAKGKQGRVVVQFIVNKEGCLQDVQLLRCVDPLLDEEALRVVNSMPRWKPGKQKGQPVNVQYTLPVVFSLQDKVQEKI